ncbi:MAG: hypothetical protein NTX85_02005 [Candidatus Nomurabacteria bacterium]|nr:hypothetical protein [Candidatus Nomurabacteria bacterium]
MEDKIDEVNTSKTSAYSAYSLGRALNMCYEYNSYARELQIRVEKLKKRKQEEAFVPLLNEIKSKIPEKFIKFFEYNFSFEVPENPKDEKHNLFKMIKEDMYGCFGIIMYRIDVFSLKSCGFLDVEDFLDSLPILNESFDGIFHFGCYQSNMPIKEIKKMSRIALSFRLDKPDFVRENNKKSMDYLFNIEEKLNKIRTD